MRIIYSGGGTGGHIFPAVAVAQEIKKRYPNAESLFIGAKGKMEMTKVPKAGFPIKGLWISGFQRSLTFKNLLFPIKLLVSIVSAYFLLRKFRPDVVAGFGGYASGAALWVATKMGLPSLIMEQNSYAGMTNRLLNGKADTACVAYEESKRFFDKCKVVVTGNPIRKGLVSGLDRGDCIHQLGLDSSKKTILIVGGSLGARSINKAIDKNYEHIKAANGIQLLWQCGAGYFDVYKDKAVADLEHVHISAFIEDMAVAYGSADLVVCRAGALTLAELMHLGKASLLVPSPNVAEDHQTANAMSLVDKGAAVLLADKNVDDLMKVAVELLDDQPRLEELKKNIKLLAQPKAVSEIADEIELLIRK